MSFILDGLSPRYRVKFLLTNPYLDRDLLSTSKNETRLNLQASCENEEARAVAKAISRLLFSS